MSPIKSLPPLPDPDHSLDCGTQPFFTAEQMREYALAALRSMPAEPVATIRYERGTPGKENDMPKVVSCNWLPDGVYSVYATQHTEAVRMSEAEIDAITKAQWGEQIGAMYAAYRAYARAVEQATAARLGVKMGDV